MAEELLYRVKIKDSQDNEIKSNVISLPIASGSDLGLVNPVAKTSSMTQEVGVDENGALYTAPSNINVVQTTGESTTNVMSQSAVTTELSAIEGDLATEQSARTTSDNTLQEMIDIKQNKISTLSVFNDISVESDYAGTVTLNYVDSTGSLISNSLSAGTSSGEINSLVGANIYLAITNSCAINVSTTTSAFGIICDEDGISYLPISSSTSTMILPANSSILFFGANITANIAVS